MAKALKTAAIVVGAVALIATGVGAAAGAGLIGVTVAGTATFAGVAASTFATIGTLAGVASAVLSVGAMLAAKPPPVTGNQTAFSANPDDGLPWLIGRSGTAGKITYRIGFDTRDAGDNDRQSFISVLSVGPIDAIEGQTVDKVPTNYTAGGAAIGAYSGWMWSRTQLGALPEATALGFGDGAGTPPGWTAQHKLSGKAAASWTLRFDTKGKQFQGGVPAPLWIARGARCYDPTKDSTYPGGSGPHRIADPSDTAAYDAAMATWEWTENPYLIAMRWAHGIWQRDKSKPGSTYQRVMGIGSPWALIDVAAYVEGRNIAQANGWKAGGVVYSTDGKWDAMKRILQAGMGEPMPLGAKISCLVNAPKVSLATITTDDVVGAASVTATQARRDRLNTITPRFRLEANNWALLPGTPISVPEYVAFDKGKRSRMIDYPYIQSTSQVATAVRYDIENAREFGPIVLPLKLVWMGYKPGDCVTATLPEVGLNAQPILLLNRQLSPASGIVTMTARSETAGKHAFALGQTTTPPPTPGVTAQPLVPTPKDGAWTLSALPAGDQLVTPTLAISGTCEANVDGIVFEYRVFDSGAPWTAAGSDAANATRREITGLRAGTGYEVAVSYTKAGVSGERRVIGPVTTAVVSVKGDKGDDGVSAYAILLTNEGHILPADADGNVTSYNGAATDVVIYAAGEDVTASFALSVTDNPQALAITIAGKRATVTGGLDVSEPNAVVTLRMTGSGDFAGVVLEKVFGLTKSRAGADAEPPVLIAIDASAQTVRYDTAGVFVPGQSITFTATRQNTDQPAVFRLVNGAGAEVYAAVASGWVSAFPTLCSSSGPDNLTFNAAGLEANIRDNGGTIGRFSVRASVDDAGRYFADTVSVHKVRDGAKGENGTSALVAILTNESFSASYPPEGGTDIANEGDGQMRVYLGSTEVTGQCSFTWQEPFNLSATIDAAGNYHASKIYADSAYAILIATYQGKAVSKRLSGTRVRRGSAGAPAVGVSVSARPQTVRYDAAGAFVGGQTVTFTAERKNTGQPTIFRLLNAAGDELYAAQPAAFVAASPSVWQSSGPDNLSLTPAGLAQVMADNGGAAGQFGMRVSVDDSGAYYTDVVSIQKVRDGAKGADALVGYLTNEAHNVAADAAGNPVSFAGANGQFKVFLGSVDVTAGCTFAKVSDSIINADINASGAYGLTAFPPAAKSGYAIFRATYPGFPSIEQTFSLTKTNAGSDGSPAVDISLSASSQQARYNKAGQLVSGPITFTVERKNLTEAPIFRFEALDGNPHADSTAAGLVAGSPNIFSSTGLDNLTITDGWLDALMAHNGQGFARLIVRTNSGVASDRLSIVKVKDGADGQNAYVLLLSNEAHTVPADPAGNVTSYAGAAFSYRVMYGAQDVTSDFQLSDNSNPQGLSIPGAFPNYSVNGGFDANEDVATFTGVVSGKGGTAHAGVSLTKTFTLAKSKAGANAPLITLTSDKDYARYDKADAYVGGPITFTAVRQSIAGTGTYFRIYRVSDGAVLAANASEGYASGGPNHWAGSGGDKLVMSAEGVRDYIAAYGTFMVEAYRDGYTVTDSVSIAKVKDGADGVNGQSALAISVSPATVDFPADYQGNLLIEAGDRSMKFTLRAGETDVSNSTAWSIVQSTGCTPTIDGTGRATFSAVSGTGGSFRVKATYSGKELTQDATVTVTKAAAPPTTNTSSTVSVSRSVNLTTYPAEPMASTILLTTGNSGVVVFGGYVEGYVTDGGTSLIKTWQGESKIVYRAPGGSWQDATPATPFMLDAFKRGGSEPENEPAYTSFKDLSVSGLQAAQTYEFGVMVRKRGGSTNATCALYGTFSASAN